tara:strand:- start:543 stop:1772 length:1230 start_codon:yes stop_codon:yes gene_type:complete
MLSLGKKLLKVENICKGFRLYKSPSDRFLEIFLRKQRHTYHQALENINFELKPGQSLGIIGSNGAGKSTLLKLMLGVLVPDSGIITINGRATGLLELGTGFNHELTGEENLRVNALLLGMSEKQIEDKIRQITDFSEVGHFIKEPLKIYSSGMIMRLAFSIAIHASPDCFIVDEALSVGDAYFQQKCMRKILEFRKNGGALLFVSHDLNAVKLLCDMVLVLEKGKIVTIAEPGEATKVYNRSLAKVGSTEIVSANNNKSKGFGTRRAELLEAKIIGSLSGKDSISSGEKAEIKCTVFCNEKIDDLVIGFLIRDRFGQDVYGTNSYLMGVEIPSKSNETFQANWDTVMNLGPGKYTLTVALHVGPDHTVECLHWEDATLEFEIAGVLGPNFVGLCKLEPSLTLISNNINK